MNRIAQFFIVALVLIFAVQGVGFAQQATVAPIPQGVPNVVGLAVGMVPEYEGSDDYEFAAVPIAQYTWDNRYIALSGTQFEINLLDHETFLVGPLANYRPGRDDVDDNAVDRMKDIDPAVEVGAFVGAKFADSQNPRIRARVGLDLLADVSDEHDGYTFHIYGTGWYPVGPQVDIGLRGGSTYADDDYMSTYFGVSQADSLRSGLRRYSADGGIKDIYFQPMVAWHINKEWHAVAALRIKRLLSDAEDSPVVDDRGSANQYLLAVGIVYSF